MPADKPTHHFAWLQQGDKTLDIVRVRRNVLEQQPITFATLRQEIEAEDFHRRHPPVHRRGHRHRGDSGLANVAFHDSVFRWTDEFGRVTHATYQEIWFDRYQRALKARTTRAAEEHVPWHWPTPVTRRSPRSNCATGWPAS